MKQQSDLSELLFPERLVLQYENGWQRKNWHTYRSAVETAIRLRGLEAHLQTETRPAALEGDEKEMKKWDEDDKLCISIITLNIQGELPLRLGRSCEEGRTAGGLWKEFCGKNYPLNVGKTGGAPRSGSVDDDTFMKVIIGSTLGGFLLMGLIMVIRAPPSAFLPPSHH